MPRHNTPADFWSRVHKGAADECWPWFGPVTDRGYGKLSFGGKDRRAHQVAFFLANGYYPAATLHTCDNRPCCNPEHLWPGTNGLNNKDRAAKGRSAHPKNERHPMCKLSNEQVLQIRALKGTMTYREIGERFGIGDGYAWQICNRPGRRELP